MAGIDLRLLRDLEQGLQAATPAMRTRLAATLEVEPSWLDDDDAPREAQA